MSQIVLKGSEVIEKAIGELTRLNSQFEQTSQDVIKRQMGLTDYYRGDSSDVFRENFLKEKDNFQKFQDAIQEYIKALTDILRNYEDMEEKNKAIAKS